MVPLFVVHRDKQARWQLRQCGVLTLAQVRDQGDLPVGELQRVVMPIRLLWIDLPETRDLLFETAIAHEGECCVAFDVSLKRNFGPW